MDLVSLPFCEGEFLHHTYGTSSFHCEAMKDRQASLGLHTGIWANKLSWPGVRRVSPSPPQAPTSAASSQHFILLCFLGFCFQRHSLLELPLVLLLAQMRFYLCEMTSGVCCHCSGLGGLLQNNFSRNCDKWKFPFYVFQCENAGGKKPSKIFLGFSLFLQILNLRSLFSTGKWECLPRLSVPMTMWRNISCRERATGSPECKRDEDLLGSFLFMRAILLCYFFSCSPCFSIASVAFSQRETRRRQRKKGTFPFENRAGKKRENPGLVSSCCLET